MKVTAAAAILTALMLTGIAAAQEIDRSTTSQISLECSTQASDRNLHGVERSAFRTRCKEDLEAKARAAKKR